MHFNLRHHCAAAPSWRPGVTSWLLCLLALLQGCATTVTERDLPLPRRLAPATAMALGDVTSTSQATTFTETDVLADGLRTGFARAQLFGSNASRSFRLHATVLDFDIPLMDRGPFPSRLVVRYDLTAPDGAVISHTITSRAQDDTGYFAGAARAARSRTRVVADNIFLYVQALDATLEPKQQRLFSP